MEKSKKILAIGHTLCEHIRARRYHDASLCVRKNDGAIFTRHDETSIGAFLEELKGCDDYEWIEEEEFENIHLYLK